MAERLSALPLHLRPRALRERDGALRRVWISLTVALLAMAAAVVTTTVGFGSILIYGAAAIALVWAMMTNRRARKALFLPPPDAVGASRQARVHEALLGAARRPTLQELSTHLKWDQAAVAEALYGLIMTGKVEEDLDDRSGEAIYGVTSSLPEAGTVRASADAELADAIEQAAQFAHNHPDLAPQPRLAPAPEPAEQSAPAAPASRKPIGALPPAEAPLNIPAAQQVEEEEEHVVGRR